MKYTPERRICILSQSHLCNNPRVLKEAIVLSENGYVVYILNAISSGDLLQQDLDSIKHHHIYLQPVSDLSRTTIRSVLDRLINKLGRGLVKYLKIQTFLALGYGSFRYVRKSAKIHAALYICHQELATYTGTRLLKKGFKVAFDFEDWYSEDLLEDARSERPIGLLRKAESIALREGAFSMTTSAVLASKLAQTYDSKLPGVIYNVFPSNKSLLKAPKEFTGPLKLLWFSQTIGPGRGIENFIQLLKHLDADLELHLMGNISEVYQNKLSAMMPRNHLLYFHPSVSAKDLPEKIAEFDIGLALEMTQPMSRNYTITNKFFQYLQSGLPVIASATDGQNEGFTTYLPGFKLSQSPGKREITALEQWLNDPAALDGSRQKAVAAANFYNWENESKKIIQFINYIFENAG